MGEERSVRPRVRYRPSDRRAQTPGCRRLGRRKGGRLARVRRRGARATSHRSTPRALSKLGLLRQQAQGSACLGLRVVVALQRWSIHFSRGDTWLAHVARSPGFWVVCAVARTSRGRVLANNGVHLLVLRVGSLGFAHSLDALRE